MDAIGLSSIFYLQIKDRFFARFIGIDGAGFFSLCAKNPAPI